MATAYDFAPLFRSSIGFDRLVNMLENAQRGRSATDWPPYDIRKTGDDSYQISIAVAGFGENDLSLTFQSNLLTVAGTISDEKAEGFLHRGIVARPFEHRFELADHVRVTGAYLTNGMLSVDLVREIPDEMKPRKIAIQSGSTLTKQPLQIDSEHAA
jgi:molecular chaperone IbpA